MQPIKTPSERQQTRSATIFNWRSTFIVSCQSMGVWILDTWRMLRTWRSNHREIQACLRALETASILTESTDCASLCTNVGLWRRRPLQLVAYPFGRNISGLVLSWRDHDVIYFAEHAHPLLGMHAILHEVGHLLLGHVHRAPSSSDDHLVKTQDIEYALKRSCYDHRREVQAERLAYLLRQRWLEVRPPTYTLQGEDTTNVPERLAWERFTTYLNPLPPD